MSQDMPSKTDPKGQDDEAAFSRWRKYVQFPDHAHNCWHLYGPDSAAPIATAPIPFFRRGTEEVLSALESQDRAKVKLGMLLLPPNIQAASIENSDLFLLLLKRYDFRFQELTDRMERTLVDWVSLGASNSDVALRRRIVKRVMRSKSDFSDPEKLRALIADLDAQRVPLPRRNNAQPRKGTYAQARKNKTWELILQVLKRDLHTRKKPAKPGTIKASPIVPDSPISQPSVSSKSKPVGRK